MAMFRELSALVVLLGFLHCAQAQDCYKGWYSHAGSCYGFGQEEVSWANAESLCRVYEASLAEIESKAENDFLKQVTRNQSIDSKGVWLGGTDIFNEGSWVWVNSKQPITAFTDWASGQPDNYGYPGGHEHGGEDCLQMFDGGNWQWNDEDCDYLAYFICEIRFDFK